MEYANSNVHKRGVTEGYDRDKREGKKNEANQNNHGSHNENEYE